MSAATWFEKSLVKLNPSMHKPTVLSYINILCIPRFAVLGQFIIF